MIKRAILNLGAGLFRVSKPGVDVTVALEDEFLLKEDYFYGQVVETGFVSTPTSNLMYTVDFLTDVGFIPLVLIWPIMYSKIVRPGVTYNRNNTGKTINYSFTQPSNTRLAFFNPASSDIDGFYYQVCRAPKG